MNLMRYICVSVLLAVLSACGPDQEPAKLPANSETSAIKQDQAVAPPVEVDEAAKAGPSGGQTKDVAETDAKPEQVDKADAAKSAVKLDLNLDLEPTPKLETDFEPELEPEPAVEQPVKKAPAPKPVAKLPKVELDLSLPKDLVKELNDADTNEYNAERALPPMFAPEGTQPEPFELSGKLIMDETHEKGSGDSIDGAQLQFKFKQ
ncbi:hypothetical protein [Pseudomonas sp. M30-35]|uniref:hypothetical protein n=1 Tax=Pseudomonas sp. M30-35 TaxID=1981174 RepID=UPI000B3C11A6|nr:hypothetical protein [Pseudomonas sp. M30-35]ARU88805.1 hypothetical protein B9K09_12895 [Pseudomonas sp. M30-35]